MKTSFDGFHMQGDMGLCTKAFSQFALNSGSTLVNSV